MDYQRPGHHTLSVYLQGGHATHLIETPRETGSPGCHCILPAEHESRWNVAGPLRFVHLYLSADAWADRAVRLLDAEPRAITLEQRIFGADAALAAWGQHVAGLDWQDPAERLRIDALSQGSAGPPRAASRPAPATPARRTLGRRPVGTGPAARAGLRRRPPRQRRAEPAAVGRPGPSVRIPFRTHVPRLHGLQRARLGLRPPAGPRPHAAARDGLAAGRHRRRLRLRQRQPPQPALQGRHRHHAGAIPAGFGPAEPPCCHHAVSIH